MICIIPSDKKITPHTSYKLYHLPSVQITTSGDMASHIEIELLYMLNISLFVITEVAFIVGLLIHTFIIAVNVIDWRKGKTMTTSDQVILSVMISRMFLQFVIQLNLFWKLICATCSPVYGLVIRIIYFSNMHSSICLSTLLCMVFHLKISNFHSVFFLWLRRIVSKRILYLIIASLMVSIVQTSVTYLVPFVTNYHFVSLNSTQGYLHQPFDVNFAVFLVNMLGPLLIFLFSSLLLITSLYLHIRKMMGNRKVKSSLDAYYRIIKYTAGTLFTSVVCVFISGLGVMYYYLFGIVLLSFSWTTFGTFHSILLIYATPKMKDTFSKTLTYLSNCFKKKEELQDFVMTVTA